MLKRREVVHRWAAEIVKYLAPHAAAYAARRCVPHNEEIDELTLQGLANEAFIDYMPLSDFVKREVSIRRELNFSTSRNPCCDIALFCPWTGGNGEGADIFTFIEIKRTSQSYSIAKDLARDVARLAILSKHYGIPTYFMLCGRTSNIGRLFSDCFVSRILSNNDDGKPVALRPKQLSSSLDDDYKKAVSASRLKKIKTLLLSSIDASEFNYAFYLWRITTRDSVPDRGVIRYFISAK